MKIESLDDDLLKVLAGACLESRLHSLLLFNGSFNDLESTAKLLHVLLQEIYRCKVSASLLSSDSNEDNLWGQWRLTAKQQPRWQAGLLQPPENEIRIIKIADLSTLSLAASRTILTTANQQPVSLQRHGQNLSYTPKLFYLAALPDKNSAGLLSAHLLARFALRLHISPSFQDNHFEQLQRALSLESESMQSVDLSDEIKQSLQQAKHFKAACNRSVLEQILNYFETPHHHQRELNLARLAIAFSRLAQSELKPEHIKQAASLLGLKEQQTIIEEPENGIDDIQDSEHLVEEKPSPEIDTQPSEPKEPESFEPKSQPVYDSQDTLSDESQIPLLLADNPYPEDTVAIQHDPAPLQLPLSIHQRANSKGIIIGTQSTRDLQDIAWTATLLEAAKFQHRDKHGKLKILACDLKKYRRAAVAEQLFMLVLDYTCLKDCQWQQALVPHLRYAYLNRVAVELIQVGEQSKDEFRAHRITARRVIVPVINQALNAKAGRATPLAHGLELALYSLRRNLHHGRAKSQQAVLVVLTDGRGNVPLEASYQGKVDTEVGTKGIEDCFKIAANLKALPHLKTVLLNPQPSIYKDLPLQLAQALGTEACTIEQVE